MSEKTNRGFVSKRVGLIFLLALIVVLSSVFLARPVYRGIRLWRAHNLADSALELFEQDSRSLEAMERARAAYELAPLDLEVVRVVGKILIRSDAAAALPYLKVASELSGGAAEDRLLLVESAFEMGLFDLVEENLAQLETLIPENPDFLFARARFLMGLNRVEEAVEVVKPLLALDSYADTVHLFYVQLTQLLPSRIKRQEGLRHLWELGQRTDSLGLSALKNLARYPEKEEKLVQELMRRLSFHPESGLGEHLLILELRLELAELSPEETLAEAVTLLNPKEDKSLIQLGRWLNRHSLYDQTVFMIDEDRAMTRRDLYLILVDALAVSNRWDDVSRILDKPKIPIESTLKYLFKMRAHRARGDFRRAELEWERVLLSAADDQEELWNIVHYGSRLGLDHYTRLALEKLTSHPSSLRRALNSLLKLEQLAGDTSALRDVLARLVEIYPEEASLSNDLAYTNLLLGEQIETSLEEASHMVSENPQFLAHKITLALANLRTEDAASALQVLDRLNLDWSRVRPRWRVIWGTVLSLNGRVDEAALIVEGLDARALLPEERQLYDDIDRVNSG